MQPHHTELGAPSANASRTALLILCAVGALLFYILSGVAQEYVYTQYDGFSFGFFLTLFQFASYAFFSGIHWYISPGHQRQHMILPDKSIKTQQNFDIKWYFLLGALMVAGVGLGNQALSYINYPTKILFKSSKLLFVMAAGVFITKKKYGVWDYAASLLMMLGLFGLFYANNSAKATTDVVEAGLGWDAFVGASMLFSALASDSVASNVQEKILQEMDRTPTELIFWGHLVGACILVVVCVVVGQLFPAIEFCVKNPSILIALLFYAVLSYVGVQFVHTCTKSFGIIVTLTITSSRKVISVMLSYILFPKPLTLVHFFAIVLVFIGIFLRIYSKNRDVFDEAFGTLLKSVKMYLSRRTNPNPISPHIHAHLKQISSSHSTGMDLSPITPQKMIFRVNHQQKI
ncbi:hypothetical protein AKO1_008011 [Acrasis kona]|uniref:Solute carrier family 35 member B3 n=1 Tax=Acrasis kona TaxID=1008807 RepID=A0AAW2YSJ1_9EUKA